MPLTINVGLSRKSSENFQSRGTSINVTAELDHSLLAKPEQLHQQIQALYRQAQNALDQQTGCNGGPSSRTQPQPRTPPANNRNGSAPTQGASQPSGHVRAITPSQQRALHAIADKLSLDLEQESQNSFGCSVSQLTIKEASNLIDRLKASQSQQNAAPTRGARR